MATATAPRQRVNDTTARLIEVDRIDPDPDQPRTHFDDAELDRLGASMRELGQLQAITVRYLNGPRRYRLISGERRWRAAQRVGITHLHALVKDITEDEALPRAVAENLGRADMRPMEEATAFSRLEERGYSRDEIARLSGKSVEYVGYRIDLLGMIGPARVALDAGHLPVGTAWYVAKLSPAVQQRFLTKWVRGDFPTVRDAEAFAQACRTVEENQQDDLFAVEAMSEEQRADVERRRRKVTSKIDRLAGAGEILHDLATTDPVELARLLAGLPGGVPGYRLRVDYLHTAAGKAAAALRKAAAIAAAGTPDNPTPADTLT